MILTSCLDAILLGNTFTFSKGRRQRSVRDGDELGWRVSGDEVAGLTVTYTERIAVDTIFVGRALARSTEGGETAEVEVEATFNVRRDCANGLAIEPPLGPVSERGAVSVALVPDDSYPAGFAVRIRPLVGLAAGSSAEARCRVSYDVKTGTKVDVVALGHGETELVKRLAGSFERAVLSFALASGAAATSGSDDDLWRKFVFWASKRDGGAGWYDELGRLGKPTTPERLVGVTGGARI